MAARTSHSWSPTLVAAFSTTGAFLATLIVLLTGTIEGTRPWILILRAASAFFLVSGILRMLALGWTAFSSSTRITEHKPKGVS